VQEAQLRDEHVGSVDDAIGVDIVVGHADLHGTGEAGRRGDVDEHRLVGNEPDAVGQVAGNDRRPRKFVKPGVLTAVNTSSTRNSRRSSVLESRKSSMPLVIATSWPAGVSTLANAFMAKCRSA
jgi:hypothetical protein